MNLRTALRVIMLMALAATRAAAAQGETLERIADRVAATHMAAKKIPGLSIAVVHRDELAFAGGYGRASIEFDLAAGPDTVYPISSVSKIFAGIVAVRLAAGGQLELDAPIGDFLPDVPADKQGITLRHLLQHTHGLDDFYLSDEFQRESGQSIDEAATEEPIRWSLNRPLRFAPGGDWSYSLAGYVLLGHILEILSGESYVTLVEQLVLAPLGMQAYFGGSETVVEGRNPVLYELEHDAVVGHVVDFDRKVWPAGGVNLSVSELAKLFIALDGEVFLSERDKQELWGTASLPGGRDSGYGLGWSSYITSQDRHVVGHEGGGASWVIYYPERRLAVIALSNMSGAKSDILPYEIARAAFDAGLIPDRDL